jgi:hypothetical protein
MREEDHQECHEKTSSLPLALFFLSSSKHEVMKQNKLSQRNKRQGERERERERDSKIPPKESFFLQRRQKMTGFSTPKDNAFSCFLFCRKRDFQGKTLA